MNGSSTRIRHKSSPRIRCTVRLYNLLGCIAVSIISFYSGLLVGVQSASCPQIQQQQQQPCPEAPPPKDNNKPIIPPSMNKLFAGMARVDRDEFTAKYDTGVPLDKTQRGNEDVLLLFSDEKALPHKSCKDGIPKLHSERAVQHCNSVKVILQQPSQTKQCLAIVGQWESFHIQRFLRWDEEQEHVSENLPLKFVGRGPGNNGKVLDRPMQFKTHKWMDNLLSYLRFLPDVLKQLKPVAESVARNNTIVVMVCNLGQSELLVNFVCSARARGFDLSQVLVFCTDLETKALVEKLGLTAFYDEINFERIPQEAAKQYADKTFGRMMLAKLYCVHMINKLGYDLLFQDVDIVWYRNPLEYFSNMADFDIVFQQDGSPTRRFAPYSPNTGFYYVKNNDKTDYFFHSLLMQGNLILGSGSHQSALTTILSEHASWRGLHVKVVSVETGDLPGGFHFHRRKQFMKDLVQNKVHPYMFHMSWTENKDNKRAFFEQLGDWYVTDECVADTSKRIVGRACCLVEPIVKCHYRDKPSKIPCKDSPPIDAGKPSFW